MKKMKRTVKILIIALLLLFFKGHDGFAQVTVPGADSVQAVMQKEKSGNADIARGQETQAEVRKQAGRTGNNNSNRAVKQVNSRRPDMTKARGARPPSIVRPSGSQVPRGVGKPGGAGRHGGR
jgi:hypothetical protein